MEATAELTHVVTFLQWQTLKLGDLPKYLLYLSFPALFNSYLLVLPDRYVAFLFDGR